MLFWADWAGAAYGKTQMKIAKTIPMQRADVTGFGRDFSHSERAELFPEVPISNMGLLARIRELVDLDAHGSAAAGRKLTLEQGLGADFRNHRPREKGQGLLPALG